VSNINFPTSAVWSNYNSLVLELKWWLAWNLITVQYKSKTKSNVHYTRLLPFWMSRVSALHGFASGPTHQCYSGGESFAVIGSVMWSWSVRDLNPIHPTPVAEVFHLCYLAGLIKLSTSHCNYIHSLYWNWLVPLLCL